MYRETHCCIEAQSEGRYPTGRDGLMSEYDGKEEEEEEGDEG